ncbi:MAG TPA: hypothetical protein VG602_09265 [Actinomycetota bacterium]|nr:hypothetical protein [Actinomycetota bacterium]
MTPEEWGALSARLLFLVGAVVVPILLAIRLRRRRSRNWWLPIPLGAVVVIVVLAALVTTALRPEPTRRLDPASVFQTSAYSFGPVPPDVLQRAEGQLSAELGDGFEDIDARSIATPAGRPLGAVVVAALDPRVARGQLDDFARGMASTSGATPQPVDVAGHSTLVIRDTSLGVVHVTWQRGNLLVAVSAPQESAALEIAGALLAEPPVSPEQAG